MILSANFWRQVPRISSDIRDFLKEIFKIPRVGPKFKNRHKNQPAFPQKLEIIWENG
jgi:hypothetical protein